MAEAFTRWDVVDYLHTWEDARLYLEAAANEDSGDGRLIQAALNNIARAQRMGRLGSEAEMIDEGLCEELSENGNPTFRYGHDSDSRARDCRCGLSPRTHPPYSSPIRNRLGDGSTVASMGRVRWGEADDGLAGGRGTLHDPTRGRLCRLWNGAGGRLCWRRLSGGGCSC